MKMTLAEININLDRMMMIIDETEELTDKQIDEFLALKAEREVKIDGWIGYWDRAKHFVAELKERSDRFKKAHKAAINVEKRIKERIKFHIRNDRTGVKFKGRELGTLYLQNNPKSVAHLIPTEDVRLSSVVTDTFYKKVCKEYLKEFTVLVLDKTKIKADLEAGIELPWATLEQKQHVRVKAI